MALLFGVQLTVATKKMLSLDSNWSKNYKIM
jgi:hypothetical protein